MGCDMKKHGDKDSYFFSEKSFHELGAQPRKSDSRGYKPAQDREDAFDEDAKAHHHQRDQPNKKRVRVQLRLIERMF